MSEHSAEKGARAGLHSIWREAAEKGIEHGIDWPRVVLDLFRSLDAAKADRAQHDAAVRAEVGERIASAIEAAPGWRVTKETASAIARTTGGDR